MPLCFISRVTTVTREKVTALDEIKILKYLHENYIPGDSSFRFAETGGQHVIRNLKEPMNINDPL